MQIQYFALTVLIVFIAQVAFAQNQSLLTSEQVKIRELELQVESLRTAINENKENNNLLIQNANRSIDYVNGLIIFLSVLISIVAVAGGFIALSINKKLSEISNTRKELQNKIKFQRLLSEARFFLATDQRYEAEQRAVDMRKLQPESMHGYFIQATYFKIINRPKEAYEAMTIAKEKLGSYSVQIEFNLACYSSLNNDPDTAYKHLETVLSINKMFLKEHLKDKDFDNIRQELGFQNIEQKSS